MEEKGDLPNGVLGHWVAISCILFPFSFFFSQCFRYQMFWGFISVSKVVNMLDSWVGGYKVHSNLVHYVTVVIVIIL